MSVRILHGDCRSVLTTIADESVNCCLTSPPYYGLRSYLPDDHVDKAKEIGCEQSPEEFISALVEVFRGVRRVLRKDGVLWVNIGDSYAVSGKGGNPPLSAHWKQGTNAGSLIPGRSKAPSGLKPKDLIGIPWMLAFALRADGWYLRGDHVWGKPNGMPESTTDRPTRSHEYVFMLTKSASYWYDQEAVRTAPKASSVTRLAQNIDAQAGSTRANGGGKANGPMKAVARKSDKQHGHSRRHDGFNDRGDAMDKSEQQADGANLRSIWWVSPAQYREGHFAVMPDMVAEICILSGCPKGGTVLDPFSGAGTTSLVADRLGRNCIGIDLNPEFVDMGAERVRQDGGMFAEVAT